MSPSFLSKTIIISSLFYLVLPLALFLGGFLKMPWSLLSLLALFFIIQRSYKQIREAAFTTTLAGSEKITFLKMAFILVVLLLWAALSGTGLLSYQNGDHFKHNTLLYDLFRQEWPPHYAWTIRSESGPYLVYGLAFYLPATLLGSLVGTIDAVHLFHFIYLWIGLTLSFLLFCLNIKRSFLKGIFFFIFYSGLDALGHFFVRGEILGGVDHIEWWSYFWQYSSNTTLLFWTPQHMIPAFMLSLLLAIYFERLEHYKKNILCGPYQFPTLLLLLGMLWSPFVVLGLFPFCLYAYFIEYKKKKSITIQYSFYIPLLFITTILLLFYMAHYPEKTSLWIWEAIDLWSNWPKLLFFYLVEFGIYAYLIKDFFYRKDATGGCYKLSVILLTLIPLYKFGLLNDFTMRASIPALVFLELFIFKSLIYAKKDFLLFLIVTIMPITALTEMARTIKNTPLTFPKEISIIRNQAVFTQQYLGTQESLFFRYLAKKSSIGDVVPHDLRALLKDESLRE